MLALNEEYIMNEQKPKPLKVLDLTKHARNMDGTMNMTDLQRYTRRDTLFGKTPTSKTFIKPVQNHEKTGPKWAGKWGTYFGKVKKLKTHNVNSYECL